MVVVPMGNWVGGFTGLAGSEPSTGSLAVAPERNAAIALLVAGVPAARVASTVIVAGGVTVGAPWSVTLTTKVTWAPLSWLSAAEKVTVVAPRGNWTGALFETLTTPATMSTARTAASAA